MEKPNKDTFLNRGNFLEDMGMFEAATHAPPENIIKPIVKKILTVSDGSNRDQTLELLAELLAKRLGAESTWIQLATATEILTNIQQSKADLVLIPAPLGNRLEDLADRSLGSIVDELLIESPCPLLIVREPLTTAQVDHALKNCLVPVAINDELVGRAVGWGFAVLGNSGDLELAAIADQDVLNEARALLGDEGQTPGWPIFDRQRIEAMIPRYIASIAAATQRQGTADHVHVKVSNRTGRFVSTVQDIIGDTSRLIVWGTRHEHDCPAFHRAVDLILVSQGPVLVVF
jgi:nucleotide-binding universal stress UspA family protein